MDCIWYNGLYPCTPRLCTPRVGSQQVSQIKLIWFTSGDKMLYSEIYCLCKHRCQGKAEC